MSDAINQMGLTRVLNIGVNDDEIRSKREWSEEKAYNQAEHH